MVHLLACGECNFPPKPWDCKCQIPQKEQTEAHGPLSPNGISKLDSLLLKNEILYSLKKKEDAGKYAFSWK